jgi:hypothetical protein
MNRVPLRMRAHKAARAAQGGGQVIKEQPLRRDPNHKEDLSCEEEQHQQCGDDNCNSTEVSVMRAGLGNFDGTPPAVQKITVSTTSTLNPAYQADKVSFGLGMATQCFFLLFSRIDSYKMKPQ